MVVWLGREISRYICWQYTVGTGLSAAMAPLTTALICISDVDRIQFARLHVQKDFLPFNTVFEEPG
jgi:hypothetical protein